MMDLNNEYINEIRLDLAKINTVLDKIKTQKNDENTYAELNFLSEKLALDSRKLSVSKSNKAKALFDLDNENENFINLKIEKLGTDIIKISVPELLNYRHIITNKNKKKIPLPPKYFISKLRAVINKFIEDNEYKITAEKKILCIFNIVSINYPEHLVPDTDNRLYQELFNVIKQFLIFDDSYKYISYYLDTLKLGTENKTVLYLFPQKDLTKNYVEITNDLMNCSE